MSDNIFYAGKYREGNPNAISPGGFLKEFLLRQKSGLSGNFSEQGYPFNTPMWAGIEKIRFREHEYGGRELSPPTANTWWPYEQSSYLLDGLARLGILLKDKECLAVFEKNLKAFLARRSAEGRLGLVNYGLSSEWPFSVFFRAVKVYLDAFGDQHGVKEYLRTHYHAVPDQDFSDTFRGVTNVEGLLLTAEWTSDPELVEKARRVYEGMNDFFSKKDICEELPFSRLTSDKRLSLHGVTLSEELKLPVLLYLYTGETAYLTAAETALKTILDNHEQIPGLPSSNEFGQGRDPLQGYEACVITDFTWALGYFFMATGKVKYADRIEKIIFNALPGSISKDFTLLQYLSSPNQLAATPFSNHSLFLRGQAPLRQYRPDHFAQCCPGNIHRAMPNYIMRMWQLAEDGSPAAVLYGESCYAFRWMGKNISIEEKTRYPFEETIRFIIHGGKQLSVPFTLRIPEWCENPELTADGEPVADVALRPGTMFRLERTWREKSEIVLRLPMKAVVRKDRYWSWIERGPLVYSLPVKAKTEKERESRFSPLSLMPAEPWAFALGDTPEIRETPTGAPEKAYPFEEPPLALSLKAMEIDGYDRLAQERHTPEVPLFHSIKKAEKEIRLIPYGASMLRITAFPDTAERHALPVLSAKVRGPYPYNPHLPMEQQSFEPQMQGDYEFWDSAEPIQGAEDGYYDLIAHCMRMENLLAYLGIRFYSPEETDAVLALRLSDGGEGWLNGNKLFVLPPPLSGELCAPLLFRCNVKKGDNFLRIKLVDMPTPEQHRKSWGARLQVFTEKTTGKDGQ